MVGGSEIALPGAKPDGTGELERHGTELAGILVGAGGPAGLAGVAIGASVLPDPRRGLAAGRAGGGPCSRAPTSSWPGSSARSTPTGRRRTRRGADRPRRAVEPYAAFADGPEARAVRGRAQARHARRRAGRERRPGGARLRQRRRPGGAPAALTVGAADAGAGAATARVVVRTGLDVLLDRSCRSRAPSRPRAPLARRRGPRLVSPGAPAADQAEALELADFFDGRLQPRRRARGARPSPDGHGGRRPLGGAGRRAAVVVHGGADPGGRARPRRARAVPVVGCRTT